MIIAPVRSLKTLLLSILVLIRIVYGTSLMAENGYDIYFCPKFVYKIDGSLCQAKIFFFFLKKKKIKKNGFKMVFFLFILTF
jgi:hypothetical protein